MKIYFLLLITFFLSNCSSGLKCKIYGHIYSKENKPIEIVKLGQMAEISPGKYYPGIIDTLHVSKSGKFEYIFKKTKSIKDKKFSVYFECEGYEKYVKTINILENKTINMDTIFLQKSTP